MTEAFTASPVISDRSPKWSPELSTGLVADTSGALLFTNSASPGSNFPPAALWPMTPVTFASVRSKTLLLEWLSRLLAFLLTFCWSSKASTADFSFPGETSSSSSTIPAALLAILSIASCESLLGSSVSSPSMAASAAFFNKSLSCTWLVVSDTKTSQLPLLMMYTPMAGSPFLMTMSPGSASTVFMWRTTSRTTMGSTDLNKGTFLRRSECMKSKTSSLKLDGRPFVNSSSPVSRSLYRIQRYS